MCLQSDDSINVRVTGVTEVKKMESQGLDELICMDVEDALRDWVACKQQISFSQFEGQKSKNQGPRGWFSGEDPLHRLLLVSSRGRRDAGSLWGFAYKALVPFMRALCPHDLVISKVPVFLGVRFPSQEFGAEDTNIQTTAVRLGFGME